MYTVTCKQMPTYIHACMYACMYVYTYIYICLHE